MKQQERGGTMPISEYG